MACSCRKHKKEDVTQPRTVNIPHVIKPGESCMFCAEKHVSVAYAVMLAERIRPYTRQAIIGELECARRHTFLEYGSECATITAALRAFVLRRDDAGEILTEAQKVLNQTVTRIEAGEDTAGSQLYVPQDGLTYEAHPLIGELFFCSAFRLAFECGYESVNRSMIVGDLSLAQVHLYRYNYNFAERIRDIRHRVQRSEFTSLAKDWVILAQNMDVAITPNIDKITEKYGSDLSWYLGN